MKLKIKEEDFIRACEGAKSMAEAASRLKINFNTFKKHAVEHGIYKPNQSGRGIHKESGSKIPLEDILEGKHPQYQTFKLKKRLFESGIKQNKCELCKIEEWNDKKLNCELDHIDGNRTNHRLSNLRILCPNCHSQTDTFRSKNRNSCLDGGMVDTEDLE